MPDEQRRVTDQLELTDAQKAFLDQVIVSMEAAVQHAVVEHEKVSHSELLKAEEIDEVVRMVLASGDYVLPKGVTPDVLIERQRMLIAGQAALEARHDTTDRNINRILDVVVGPVKQDFLGDDVLDGERDESRGLMASTQVAIAAAEKLDAHLSNGGVPVKLPTSIKAAIWGAAGTVIASALTAAALIVTAPH